MDHQYQDQDEEKKAKKKYVLKVILLTSFIWLLIFTLIVVLSNGVMKNNNAAILSNVTNTSMVQGYLVGYQTCQDNMMNMINQSVNTCQLIRANVGGRQVELTPTSCIPKNGG